MKDKIIVGIFIFVVVIFLFIVYTNKSKQESNYPLEIYFFQAGKADAIVLSKNGKYMMIDTGYDTLSEEILSYFKQKKITRLEYLVITHFDKDHVGSASTVIRSIEIGEVLQSNVPKESEYYNNYISALKEKNISPHTVSGDYVVTLDDMEVIINGPEKIYDKNESNNSSLIVSVIDHNNKFLFMGDSQNARIKDYLQTNPVEYDFLKVPYHGHYLKRLNDFLERNTISSAVITSSLEELEDEETISMLKKYSIQYYLTRNGKIRVLSNGNDIIIKQ